MRFRVERQNFSRSPWRVLDATTGEQVYQRERLDHPNLGPMVLDGPVCFSRKKDAVAWIESHTQLTQ